MRCRCLIEMLMLCLFGQLNCCAGTFSIGDTPTNHLSGIPYRNNVQVFADYYRFSIADSVTGKEPVKGDLYGGSILYSQKNFMAHFGYRNGTMGSTLLTAGTLMNPLAGNPTYVQQTDASMRYLELKAQAIFFFCPYFGAGCSYQNSQSDFSSRSTLNLTSPLGSAVTKVQGTANVQKHYLGPDLLFMLPLCWEKKKAEEIIMQHQMRPRLTIGPRYQITESYQLALVTSGAPGTSRTTSFGASTNWGLEIDAGTDYTYHLIHLNKWSVGISLEAGFRYQQDFGSNSQQGIYGKAGFSIIW